MLANQDDGQERSAERPPAPSNRFTDIDETRPARGGPDAAELPALYVVHEDPAELRSLGALFRAQGLEVELFPTLERFLAHGHTGGGPACLVVDARRPGRVGVALQMALLERGLDLPLVCITSRQDSSITLRALGRTEPGGRGLDRHDRLAEEVTSLLGEREQNPEPPPEAEAFQRNMDRLTDREREVAERVVTGLLNKQIAHELGISPETVKVHRARVMRKMAADSLAQLVMLWARYGSQVA